ncbi:rhodanese-like domain-containing protein [Spongiivirga citrea]|uniref:Rhodanese-like domain-containing protein n=1 Tax=Spongiivirga citrea TaxID=1481457 RepID=A0A6M0CLE4_9FLAO|nr:rhodanese-like domain-containing protein [Spongiivirga citrea]NER18748.1 rhodanese-like domain-containing protein [Spongiivirga citrea]
MKKLFILFITVVSLSLLSCWQESGITLINDISVFEEVIQQEGIQLVDVRRTEEFKKGRIGNAQHIDFLQEASFLTKIEELDKNKPVYLYCHSGNRSNKAAHLLIEKGFKHVFDFSPGYKGWSAAKAKK